MSTEGRAAPTRTDPVAILGAGPLLGFLRNRTGQPGGGQTVRELNQFGDGIDADLTDRLQEVYAGALPGRLTAISAGARAGDAAALASASHTLAGTSAQLGHAEVAAVCQAIAWNARRGVLAHDLVRLLRTVTGA